MSSPPVQSNSGSTDGAGTPRVCTVGLTALTATSCLIVVEVSARTGTSTGWTISVTWDGLAMTSAVLRDQALNGFGSGKAQIFYLAVGNLSAKTANAVATASNSDSQIGISMTVKCYDDMNQGTPLNATANLGFSSGASSITLSCVSNPTDRVVGVACFAELSASGASPNSGQTKVTGISQTTGTNLSHVSGDDPAEASSPTAGNWNGFSSSFSYVMASFDQSAAPVVPSIDNVNATAFVDPGKGDHTLNGSNMNPAGVTNLYYADGSDFGTANLQVQTISSITATRVNWDTVNPGTIGLGPNFLFLVTDDGGGGEQVSAAFAMTLEDPVTWTERIVYQTDGTTGPVLVLATQFMNAKGAVIRANSATSDDTVVADSVFHLCFVDSVGGKGVCMGATSPSSFQRAQQEGTGSVFLMDGGSGADLVVGTPSLGPNGLTIDFSVATSGFNFEIFVFGGDHLAVDVGQDNVNNSPNTTLDYKPDAIFFSSVGSSTAGDSTFAIMSFGAAIHDPSLSQVLIGTNESDSTRNSIVQSDGVLTQLTGITQTWKMALSSIDVGGFTWTDSDPDSFYFMAMFLPGRKLFLDVFNKADVSPGTEQNLPDIGFDPGSMTLLTAGHNTEVLSPALGSRYSIGFVSSQGQDVVSAQALPDTGTMTAEQFQSPTNCVATSSVIGSISMLGKMKSFGQISTIEWVNSLAGNTSVVAVFAIDAGDFDDDTVMVHDG